MKKQLLAFVIFPFILFSASATDWYSLNMSSDIACAEFQIEKKALTTYKIPVCGYFLERKTITDWTKRWDKPDIVCYSYFYIGSTCIGYFITHGKPASTQSYLIPESIPDSGRQSIDVDGTYGTNNPGYRFFLANGTAVECSGAMVSCVYADAPLSLSSKQIQTIEVK